MTVLLSRLSGYRGYCMYKGYTELKVRLSMVVLSSRLIKSLTGLGNTKWQ